MNKATKIRVGVIGAGRIGALHIQHIVQDIPDVELVTICGLNRAVSKVLAKQLNVSTVTNDAALLFADSSIDAVLICSSTDTHARFCQQAAAAGKHIFCEKPIDLDLCRIDETLSIVDKAGVKFQVGFNRRFDQNFRRMREAIVSGQLGEPHLLRITSRDAAPPSIDYIKVSGGLFLDMTIHDFDMARYLIGDEVAEIYAIGSVRVDSQIGEAGDIDTAVLSLRFRKGVIGTIDNSREAVYGYDQRVEIFGSLGMLTVGNPSTDTLTFSGREGAKTSLPPYFFVERYKAAFLAELQAFFACIREDTVPLVTGEDGRAPVVMALAAMQSLRENRPVQLSGIRRDSEAVASSPVFAPA